MEYQCLVEQTDEKETDEKPLESPEEQKDDVGTNTATEDPELDEISIVDELMTVSEPDSKKSEKRLRKTSSDMDVEESAGDDAVGSENNSMPELNLESEAPEPVARRGPGRPRKKVIIKRLNQKCKFAELSYSSAPAQLEAFSKELSAQLSFF
jgi:hypothetical protein